MEHLTSQLSWVAAWLFVTRDSPVHLVDELVLVSCVLFLLMIGLMVVLLTFFWAGGMANMILVTWEFVLF